MNQQKYSRLIIAFTLLLFSMAGNAQIIKNGFIKIFDGKSMAGWDADTTFWKIKDNCFVGEVTLQTPIKTNTFLIWREALPANFELKVSYRISADGNSGINYRSEELPNIKYALKGYQADIDGQNVYTGQNYEERGRGFLAKRGEVVVLKTNTQPMITGSLGSSDNLKLKILPNDWNEMHIIVRDHHLRHYINGVLMSEVTDEDVQNRKTSGLLGFQVHVSKTMKVEYRKIRFKEL